MILWAPALDIDEEGNLAKWRNTKLKHAETAIDIAISKEKLRETTTPTKIIHGKQDQVVPIENSRKLQRKMPKCDLKRNTKNRTLIRKGGKTSNSDN